MSNAEIVRHETAGTVRREEFGASELARAADVGATALAAQAEAEVRARAVMAERHPRNEDDARTTLVRACRRPSFAETARYRKPVGGGKFAEGFSVRFAEAAARIWKNVYSSVMVVSDEPERRIVRVTVMDLECNVAEAADVVVEKTVERRQLKEGQRALRTRINSYGDVVHLVPATEDDLRNKQNAEVAKVKRNGMVHLIPGDILDECKAMVHATLANEDAKDPDAARKALVDAFAAIGVKAAHLQEYLGHELAGASPAEMSELRAVFAAIRDGEATWPEILGAKTDRPSAEEQQADPRAVELKAKIASKMEAQRKGKKAAPATPPESSPQREPGED